MNKKDIALTVGGILASLTLAYLLWRLSQNQSAAAASTDADAAAAAAAAASQQAQYDSSVAYQTATSISVPTIDSTANTDTDTTSSTGTDADANVDSLLTQIIADFAGSISAPVAGQTNNASIIPTLSAVPTISLDDIPVTATEAQAGVSGAGTPGSTQQPASGVTATPQTTTNPIIAQ